MSRNTHIVNQSAVLVSSPEKYDSPEKYEGRQFVTVVLQNRDIMWALVKISRSGQRKWEMEY